MPCLLSVGLLLSHNDPTAAEARLFHYISKWTEAVSNPDRLRDEGWNGWTSKCARLPFLRQGEKAAATTTRQSRNAGEAPG